MSDTLQLGKPHRTPEGYLAVRAKAARAGIQDYLGVEVDPEGKHFAADEIVPVYRPAEEVFDTQAVHSFLMKPITNDHPKEAVTRDNWSKLAKGVIAKAMRDGDDLAFDLILMDGPTIDEVEAGKRELSNGYAVDLSIEDGTAPDGRKFKAVQRKPRGNHIALVDRGRAGPEYRINDSIAFCDANPAALSAPPPSIGDIPMKIKIGDAEVDATNGEAVRIAVDALNVKLSDGVKALADAATKTVADAATIVAKDAEITSLTAKLADAAITPAKLRDAAKVYADTIAKAKALGVTVAEDADTNAVMKAVVSAKMGDAAKDYTADHIAIAFTALTKDAKVDTGNGIQPLGAPLVVGDSATAINSARAGWLADKQSAYRGQPNQGVE